MKNQKSKGGAPYTAPTIQLIEIRVEQGFAVTGQWNDGTDPDEENGLGDY